MKFYVIGISDNQQQTFSEELRAVIANGRIFSGGKRHHEIVRDWLPADHQWINITVPLDAVFKQYAEHEEVVVFASGDPLFYGFASTIQREMPEAELQVFPSFNSLQLLAHRLVLPYQNMHVVSLTGRPWHKLDEALIRGYDTIGILTDSKTHTPSAIAERMCTYGYDNYQLSVGELLGNTEEEKTSTYQVSEIIGRSFAFPNNVMLQKTHQRSRPLGIPDADFHLLNGRAKMITKMPIRLLSLSLLDLRDKETLWDVGFCTGSISVEAKLQFPHLRIVAFEIREEGRDLIENNARKFGTPGIESFIGDFLMQDLTHLPRPEAVFIGGHGGKLKEIVTKVCEAIQPQGCIVFNAVSEESALLFRAAAEENQLAIEPTISIKVDDYNTIQIMKGIRTI